MVKILDERLSYICPKNLRRREIDAKIITINDENLFKDLERIEECSKLYK